jgi:hypothetical protein
MSSRYFTKRIYKKRPKQGVRSPEKPKAFKSESSANDWAKTQGLKDFKVDQIADKKFKIRTCF